MHFFMDYEQNFIVKGSSGLTNIKQFFPHATMAVGLVTA